MPVPLRSPLSSQTCGFPESGSRADSRRRAVLGNFQLSPAASRDLRRELFPNRLGNPKGTCL